jgi:hypothetical protein
MFTIDSVLEAFDLAFILDGFSSTVGAEDNWTNLCTSPPDRTHGQFCTCGFEVDHREDSLLVRTIGHVDIGITIRDYHGADIGGNIKMIAPRRQEDLDMLIESSRLPRDFTANKYHFPHDMFNPLFSANQ